MMMRLITVQPDYHETTQNNRAFLIEQMKRVEPGALAVFPEYANIGGIADEEEKKEAVGYAKVLLATASACAKENKAFLAVNVLEERDGHFWNSTYLFGDQGETVFVYDKQHLPPAEVDYGVVPGTDTYPCRCVCTYQGIRFGFLTCYDVYFNEQIEYLARQKPDILVIPGLQRGEKSDILRAQAKMIAFRCNAYVVKSSFSMGREDRGGCSMIVAPDGTILKDLGASVGREAAEVDVTTKYYRGAGYGGRLVRNDDFINAGLCPHVFENGQI